MARKNVAFECKVMAAGGLCNAVQDIDIFIAECIFSYDKNIVLLSRFFSPPNSCYKDFFSFLFQETSKNVYLVMEVSFLMTNFCVC